MIRIKNIKTITIIDNDDYNKCQYVYINNIDGNGSELEIERGHVNIGLENTIVSGLKVSIEIQCGRDKMGNYYSTRKRNIVENISDNDLINELKKRNILSEEIVYKIKE